MNFVHLHKTRLYNTIHSAAYNPWLSHQLQCCRFAGTSLTCKLLNISLTVSDSTHKHSTRTFTIQQPWDKWERSWDCPCNLRHNMVVDNSPITSQPESLGLYWMGTEVEPWPFSNRKLHNVCSWASFMIGLHYLPTIHERKSGSLFYLRSISPFLGHWGLVFPCLPQLSYAQN